MNVREYSENPLVSYLLGSLPDNEGENFDELSFTNEDFSTALKSFENDLIDAYLHEQLNDVSLKRFDSYYLFSVLRQEKVNFAKSLQIYIEKNIASVKAGVNQLPKISFSKETILILLTLKTEINDHKSHRVILIDESNKKLRQSGNVRIRNETINISFPANLLKTRIYSMIVSGIRDGGETEIISSYAFRVVPR
jgi:hypothetical protein